MENEEEQKYGSDEEAYIEDEEPYQDDDDEEAYEEFRDDFSDNMDAAELEDHEEIEVEDLDVEERERQFFGDDGDAYQKSIMSAVPEEPEEVEMSQTMQQKEIQEKRNKVQNLRKDINTLQNKIKM